MSNTGMSGPLLAYVGAVQEHRKLQEELRRVDTALGNVLENRGNIQAANGLLGRGRELLRELGKAEQEVHRTYDAALAALDSGLAATAQSGAIRTGQNWLAAKQEQIKRNYTNE